ncbi:MAG TPA: ADP-ribosylglycohydrolase family protein [Anaerolineae bacterium]|nr:ADP-ribosylglycohydrolase family protein [Anaerolineae bacterium]
MPKSDFQERALGALVGLAVGDAVGTTLEFRAPGSFTPITDMVGGGPFQLPVGAWTDDTSMALCLGYSLVEKGGFDGVDQMERYVAWYREGYLSSTGVCFDIGNTVRGALERFEATGEPFSGSTDRMSAGNGSVMRLAPVPIFYYPDEEKMVYYAGESSRTTHGALEAVEACRLWAVMLGRALRGVDKEGILDVGGFESGAEKVVGLAEGKYRNKKWEEIAGTGYVVASVEAALYCFAKTEGYEEAVLAAANLGDDADTTAAICGQLAGAFYGLAGIPGRWRERLVMYDEIVALGEALIGGR